MLGGDQKSGAIRWSRWQGAMIGGLAAGLLWTHPGHAESGEAMEVGPYPGTLLWQTEMRGGEVVRRIGHAAAENGMTVTATLPLPNVPPQKEDCVVLLLYRDADAARTLEAAQAAGIEWPLRVYVSESQDHKAAVTYRTPSSIFALYNKPALDQMAGELDERFAKIIDDALGS